MQNLVLDHAKVKFPYMWPHLENLSSYDNTVFVSKYYHVFCVTQRSQYLAPAEYAWAFSLCSNTGQI